MCRTQHVWCKPQLENAQQTTASFVPRIRSRAVVCELVLRARIVSLAEKGKLVPPARGASLIEHQNVNVSIEAITHVVDVGNLLADESIVTRFTVEEDAQGSTFLGCGGQPAKSNKSKREKQTHDYRNPLPENSGVLQTLSTAIAPFGACPNDRMAEIRARQSARTNPFRFGISTFGSDRASSVARGPTIPSSDKTYAVTAYSWSSDNVPGA